MKLPQRSTLVKYGVAAGIGILMMCGYLSSQKAEYGSLLNRDNLDQLRLICDAFCIPGIMLLLSGCLVAVTNEGALDGLKYLGHYMVHMLIPGKRDSTKRYLEYVEESRAKRVTGYHFLFHVGGVFLLIGIVFYVMYKINA